jgi:hypothetical protein
MGRTRLAGWPRILVPVIASVMAAVACAGTAAAGTTVTDVTVVKPAEMAVPNPCIPSELVLLTGTIRHRFKITVDDSGGTHIQDHYTAQGSGSGYDASDVLFLDPVAGYSFSDEQLQHTNFPNPTFEYTAVFYTKVIRRGETSALTGDDAFLRHHIKLTRNANGAVTAEFIRGPTLECR